MEGLCYSPCPPPSSPPRDHQCQPFLKRGDSFNSSPFWPQSEFSDPATQHRVLGSHAKDREAWLLRHSTLPFPGGPIWKRGPFPHWSWKSFHSTRGGASLAIPKAGQFPRGQVATVPRGSGLCSHKDKQHQKRTSWFCMQQQLFLALRNGPSLRDLLSLPPPCLGDPASPSLVAASVP